MREKFCSYCSATGKVWSGFVGNYVPCETENTCLMILDGRKARHFDCNWNNDTNCQNGCGHCVICKYLDFLDYAGSVGLPEGSQIEYNKQLDKYLELKTLEERQSFIVKLDNDKRLFIK